MFLCLRSLLLIGMAAAAVPGQSAVSAKAADSLQAARNRQDLAALQAAAGRAEAQVRTNASPDALYAAALARSFEAEVALELGKKPEAAAAAESGIHTARALVAKNPSVAEHHRLLGTLCGQMIPANLLMALQYGRCAKEEIDAALKLDPRSAFAHISRGVGNYYLPASFGGGVEKAVVDFRHATTLKPDLADAWLWLGIGLRKSGDAANAKSALRRAASLAPDRRWVAEQLAKTP
jgi:tetratricopeptide (TPR) repeat protein